MTTKQMKVSQPEPQNMTKGPTKVSQPEPQDTELRRSTRIRTQTTKMMYYANALNEEVASNDDETQDVQQKTKVDTRVIESRKIMSEDARATPLAIQVVTPRRNSTGSIDRATLRGDLHLEMINKKTAERTGTVESSLIKNITNDGSEHCTNDDCISLDPAGSECGDHMVPADLVDVEMDGGSLFPNSVVNVDTSYVKEISFDSEIDKHAIEVQPVLNPLAADNIPSGSDRSNNPGSNLIVIDEVAITPTFLKQKEVTFDNVLFDDHEEVDAVNDNTAQEKTTSGSLLKDDSSKDEEIKRLRKEHTLLEQKFQYLSSNYSQVVDENKVLCDRVKIWRTMSIESRFWNWKRQWGRMNQSSAS